MNRAALTDAAALAAERGWSVGPMIDVRGSGGYVLAAGSVVAGLPYEIAEKLPVRPLPGWLAELADPPRAGSPLAMRAINYMTAAGPATEPAADLVSIAADRKSHGHDNAAA